MNTAANTVMNTPELVLRLLESADLTTCLQLLVNRLSAVVWADHRYQLLARCVLQYRYTVTPPTTSGPPRTYVVDDRVGGMWGHVLTAFRAAMEDTITMRISTPISSLYYTSALVNVEALAGDDDDSADDSDSDGDCTSSCLTLTKVDPFKRVEVTVCLYYCWGHIERAIEEPPIFAVSSLVREWRVSAYDERGLRHMGHNYGTGVSVGHIDWSQRGNGHLWARIIMADYMLSDSVEVPSCIVPLDG